MPDPRGDLHGEDFPPHLMNPGMLEEVIAFLRSMPIPYGVRRKKLYYWAKALSVVLDPSYYRRLE